MSVFDLPETEGDPDLIRIEAEQMLREPSGIEEVLVDKKWFPYRIMNPMQATKEFVHVYDQAMHSVLMMNTEINSHARDHLKARGHYLNANELLIPWIDPQRVKKGQPPKLNPRWKAWIAARRSADKRGMIYEDYCYGAIVSAMKRGWTRPPTPYQMTNLRLLGLDPNDKWPDMTVEGFERRMYAQQMKLTQHPYFSGKAYRADPIQLAYAKFAARECMRVYGDSQKLRRAWKLLVDQDRVPASPSFDELLQ